ncbi:phage terminase large subunit [Prauserella muralis]|uniref:Terminase n=1 Tax=Prauserella muralis TaxID=588067 RepID=A0A2V4AZH3_9PSEU|nr:phage terminase large subunit [Prauserella muralis]PXY27421.1 terminase [Prauserella muralis]TWE22879.1 phage terminase large subunit [Prauserella muralis]
MTAPVIEHVYRPRGAALTLLHSRDPEVLLSGPAGTGKSRACLEKLHLMALLNPGMRGLMVRKTAVSLTSTGLVTYEQHVAAESIQAGHVSWYGGSQKEAAAWRYTNGSIINVGGMDKPTKIMSSEYDVIYVQEAIELGKEDWEACSSRLRNGKVSFQQLIADTNPSHANHWLKKRADTGSTKILWSKHEDNPVYFDEHGQPTERGRAYLERLDALTGVRKLRLRDGLWVSAEGIIWEEWDEAIHLVDRRPIPDSWPRWWVVDFGYTNPFVCQFWAEDPDGRLWRYREIYHTRRLVEDHARQILKLVAPGGRWKEPKPRAIVCDHDAEDRATLERHLGMSTVAAKKDVTPGIEAVATRFRRAGDGKPRLMLMRDSLVERDADLDARELPTCTEEEIPGYVWDVQDGKPPKEQPVKENDHGCDAMRYVVAERDLQPKPNVRWL